METRPPRTGSDATLPPGFDPGADGAAEDDVALGTPAVVAADPAGLVALLSTHRHVVLLLGTSSPRSFLGPVAQRYGAGAAPLAGLCYFNIRGAPEQAWILPLVEAALGDPHGVRRELRRGYYLFAEGRAIAHHPGLYHPRFDAAVGRAERAMRAAYSTQAMVASVQRQLDQVGAEAAALVIEHFDQVLGLHPMASVGPGGLDPYAVLGVPRAATASEIRAAYHSRMREHHPDLFAHLSDEDREVALRRARAIIQAYQLLK